MCAGMDHGCTRPTLHGHGHGHGYFGGGRAGQGRSTSRHTVRSRSHVSSQSCMSSPAQPPLLGASGPWRNDVHRGAPLMSPHAWSFSSACFVSNPLPCSPIVDAPSTLKGASAHLSTLVTTARYFRRRPSATTTTITTDIVSYSFASALPRHVRATSTNTRIAIDRVNTNNEHHATAEYGKLAVVFPLHCHHH